MKTKLLLWAVAFLLSKSLYAQITPTAIGQPGDEQAEQNTLLLPFTDLDKSKIETGLLLDAGMEFADLKKYNGTPTDSSFTTSKIISDVYSTLVMSKISSNGGTLKSPANFQTEWFQAQTIDLIPIGGLYFKYNQISETNQTAFKNMASSFVDGRTSDISTSTLTINPQNKIIDVYTNGIWQNPYDINKTFAMAPIANSHNKLNFNVVFPPTLFLSNFSNDILQVQVKFSDTENFQTVTFGQMIPVHYATAGEYTWTYRLTLSNGQILYSKNKFSVTGDLEKYIDIDSGNQTATTNNLTGGSYWKVELEKYQYFIPFPPTVVNKPKLTLYIKLRDGQIQITRPFIIAEGFDSGHITAPRQEAGDNNIDDFLNNVNQYSQLGIKLNEYDVIYVDWGIGTDYIQNNAELFKKAIRWVNQNKVGSAKNVVMGQSMGGLIARYALKDMEDNGENHDANLFISHDSPHLGANTPVSMQYLMRNISKTFLSSPIVAGINYVFTPIFTGGAPVSEIFTIADTPASKQMLINYVNDNYSIDNSIHNTWQNTLKTKGYPQLTRNVAISNGSECGTDQNLQNLMSYHYVSKGWFIDIIGSLIGGLTLDPWQMLISILPGQSRYYYDFEAYPMTNLNESKQLYYGKIVYKKKILWVINSQNTLLSGNRNQPSNALPIDKYGGGKYRFPINSFPNFIKDNMSVSYFSFVPTPSALDYKLGNSVLSEHDYQRPYSPVDDASDVPFVNFVAEKIETSNSENNNHISFSARNRQFVINQLSNSTSTQNEPITTAYLCGSKVNIGGDALLCGNDTITYTTGFAPTIQWSILNGSNLIDINGPTNQPQISFTPKPNANGFVKLQAYLAGDGANNTVTKNVWIGNPKIYFYQNIEDNPTQAYIGSAVSGATLEDQGLSPSQVTWRTLPGSYTKSGYSFLITTTIPEFDVEIKATNNCGTTTLQEIVIYSPICNTFTIVKTTDDSYYIVNPCPLDPKQNPPSLKTDDITTIVVDINGREIVHTKEMHFNIQSQLPGLYVAKIIKNGKMIYSQNLIKN